jgi:hypothetical protein
MPQKGYIGLMKRTFNAVDPGGQHRTKMSKIRVNSERESIMSRAPLESMHDTGNVQMALVRVQNLLWAVVAIILQAEIRNIRLSALHQKLTKYAV